MKPKNNSPQPNLGKDSGELPARIWKETSHDFADIHSQDEQANKWIALKSKSNKRDGSPDIITQLKKEIEENEKNIDRFNIDSGLHKGYWTREDVLNASNLVLKRWLAREKEHTIKQDAVLGGLASDCQIWIKEGYKKGFETGKQERNAVISEMISRLDKRSSDADWKWFELRQALGLRT